jgi:hypothetical protein
MDQPTSKTKTGSWSPNFRVSESFGLVALLRRPQLADRQVSPCVYRFFGNALVPA